MELLEILKTISILLIAPTLTALIYKTYKKPKEISELIKAKDKLHKEIMTMHLNDYKNLENKYSNLLNANSTLTD